MPYVLFLKKQQNLKLSSAANCRLHLIGQYSLPFKSKSMFCIKTSATNSFVPDLEQLDLGPGCCIQIKIDMLSN